MNAFDIDDMVIEMSRIARQAEERAATRRMIEQKGEAFKDLPVNEENQK